MGWPAGGASGLRAWLDLPDPDLPPAAYHLASADCDLPAREPERSLVIATDYRAGSTLLAEGLVGAGGYGVPLEYLQRGAMERRFARFAAPSMRAYASRVMRARTSASGVFGIKLFWPEARALEDLPDPLVIWLRREDIVAQAVSTWTALVTHVWRSTAPSATEVPYDRARLVALVAMHAHHDACWQAALGGQASGDVITVTYERLAAAPLPVMNSVVTALAQRGMPPDGAIPDPRLARQASRISQDLATRLTQDLLTARWA